MPRRYLLVAISALSLLGGCSSWVQHSVSTGARPAFAEGSAVRVTRRDDRWIVLERAAFVGDSLIGDHGSPPRRWAVAVQDIKRLEERTASARASDSKGNRSLGLLIGGGVLLLLIGAAALLQLTLGSGCD